MNSTMMMDPIAEATTPWRTESAPSDGPTVRSSRISIPAGSAPERNLRDRSSALSIVKLDPSMIPWSAITALMRGAEITLRSRTIARSWP